MSEEKPINYFEFRDVCKAFDERLVLDHVSFAVKRGETCVIMGRSGVGKSVSLKHILGFLKADSGRILIDGEILCDTRQVLAIVRLHREMILLGPPLRHLANRSEESHDPLTRRMDGRAPFFDSLKCQSPLKRTLRYAPTDRQQTAPNPTFAAPFVSNGEWPVSRLAAPAAAAGRRLRSGARPLIRIWSNLDHSNFRKTRVLLESNVGKTGFLSPTAPSMGPAKNSIQSGRTRAAAKGLASWDSCYGWGSGSRSFWWFSRAAGRNRCRKGGSARAKPFPRPGRR